MFQFGGLGGFFYVDFFRLLNKNFRDIRENKIFTFGSIPILIYLAEFVGKLLVNS